MIDVFKVGRRRDQCMVLGGSRGVRFTLLGNRRGEEKKKRQRDHE